MLKPNIVKGYRIMKGFTLQQVADNLNINIKTYHAKESGKQAFTIYEAMNLAKLFEVSIDQIFFVA